MTFGRKPFSRNDVWSNVTFGRYDISPTTTFGRLRQSVENTSIYVEIFTNTVLTSPIYFHASINISISVFRVLDGWLRMGLLPPPLGNFADISYLVEN